MTFGSKWRRWIAAMMAMAILVLGTPLVPASVMPCDHVAMAMHNLATPMAMDMKAMDMKATPNKSHTPTKPMMPCGDSGLNCLAGVGCATPIATQAALVFMPRIAMATVSWTVQIAGPGIAYKPALPPPILLA